MTYCNSTNATADVLIQPLRAPGGFLKVNDKVFIIIQIKRCKLHRLQKSLFHHMENSGRQ